MHSLASRATDLVQYSARLGGSWKYFTKLNFAMPRMFVRSIIRMLFSAGLHLFKRVWNALVSQGRVGNPPLKPFGAG
jgi:hypothetical protein